MARSTAADPVGRVAGTGDAGTIRERVEGHLAQRAPAAAPRELAGLVGGDGAGSQGRSRSGSRIVAELAPGDRPGGVGRFLGEVDVAADDEAHARHVVVIRRHDPREGDLVPGRRLRDERGVDVALHDAHTL